MTAIANIFLLKSSKEIKKFGFAVDSLWFLKPPNTSSHCICSGFIGMGGRLEVLHLQALLGQTLSCIPITRHML